MLTLADEGDMMGKNLGWAVLVGLPLLVLSQASQNFHSSTHYLLAKLHEALQSFADNTNILQTYWGQIAR